MALERFQTLIELLEVNFELILATVSDRQHQDGQIVQDRYQLIPIEPVLQTLAYGLHLRVVALGQGQIVE
ncbi:hypothetical protein D3C80_1370690 [compost metagenome]